MCIISCQPKCTRKLTQKTLDAMGSANRDGYGIMYVKNGSVVVRKTMSFDEICSIYNDVYEKYSKDSPIVLHFRLATAGNVDAYTAHPYFINKDVAFCHNGVISGVGYDKHKSDTMLYSDKVLKGVAAKTGEKFFLNKSIMALIEKDIGYNKFVFLNKHGEIGFANEKNGTWDDGVWFSNCGYKPYKSFTRIVKKTSEKPAIVTKMKLRCDFCEGMAEFDRVVKISTFSGSLQLCSSCCNEFIKESDTIEGLIDLVNSIDKVKQ